MKKCFLTLDYELFLGQDTGSVSQCLIEPMLQLNRVLDKHGVRANIFVDAAYLLKVFELKDKFAVLNNDFILVSEHLSQLSNWGHSIQLHFHPQWIYSSFIDGKWILDTSHYKIDDMSDVEINNYLRRSIELLNSLLVKPITAFRAGGYTLNNFEKIKGILKEYGIVNDSSVLRGQSFYSDFQQYDYTAVPAKSSYHFENSFCVEDVEGSFIEYPISTMRIGFISSFLDRFRYKYGNKLKNNKQWGDGKSIIHSTSQNGLFSKIKSLFSKTFRTASIDGVKSIWLLSIMKYNVKFGNEFVIIGHPKLITPFSINRLDKFIEKTHLHFMTF